MTLVYVLVCVVPVALVLLVFVAIGIAGIKAGRNGKRIYDNLKPYLDDLKAQGDRTNRMVKDFTERGNKLAETFEEINGRWAFITQSFQETKKSPMVKIVSVAGRLAGGRGKD